MNKLLFGVAAVALAGAMPASAQILGGGVGGTVGGGLGGTLGTTIERTRPSTSVPRIRNPARAPRPPAGEVSVDGATRLGERRVVARSTADAALRIDRSRTRGAAAAARRGLRPATPTRGGVQVFVPPASLAAPAVPVPVVRSYPAYGGYYYSPGAVYVEHDHVDVYMRRQHQDLEAGLAGTGATVRRRGTDLIVELPADVTFAFDKADIRPRFHGALAAFARTMSAYPGTDVEVLGHTDSVGSDAYNLGLSQRRGGAVADFLVARGVDPSRLIVEAMGETEPVATNATVEGRAANRRVELVVHPRAG